MRVSTPLTLLLVLAIAPLMAAAAPTQFPYEAVVESDGVLVRSGPGERYDPTLKLSSGQQVIVHKHEPGGWFMISPPPGSFSWIDADYIEQTGPETGIVKVPQQGDGLPPRVAVWIGSQFTDEHRYYGRQLASGDEVHILGQKNITAADGPSTYFKIAPPRHEFRWVKGDFIVPLSEAGRIAGPPAAQTPTVSANPQQSDPFANSFSAQQTLTAPGFPPEQTSTLLERELSRGIDSGAVRSSEPNSQATTAERSRLYDLDAQLKEMIAQTPNHWDLGAMERSYRELKASSGASVGAQIDSRLTAIRARQRIKEEFDAFLSVTSRTEQRDAELLSLQQTIGGGITLSPVQVELGQATNYPPQLSGAGTFPSGPTTNTPVPATPAPQSAPQMDGAGIVQRLPRPQLGLPQHALVTPDGRVLAYLQPGEGIQLDSYIGRSMGVIGRRSFDPRLRNDLITVERLTPVQLQP